MHAIGLCWHSHCDGWAILCSQTKTFNTFLDKYFEICIFKYKYYIWELILMEKLANIKPLEFMSWEFVNLILIHTHLYIILYKWSRMMSHSITLSHDKVLLFIWFMKCIPIRLIVLIHNITFSQKSTSASTNSTRWHQHTPQQWPWVCQQ